MHSCVACELQDCSILRPVVQSDHVSLWRGDMELRLRGDSIFETESIAGPLGRPQWLLIKITVASPRTATEEPAHVLEAVLFTARTYL